LEEGNKKSQWRKKISLSAGKENASGPSCVLERGTSKKNIKPNKKKCRMYEGDSLCTGGKWGTDPRLRGGSAGKNYKRQEQVKTNQKVPLQHIAGGTIKTWVKCGI